MDLDSLELARQMTILDHSLLKKLPVTQLLLKKYDKPLASPNLSLISAHFNQVRYFGSFFLIKCQITGWIATEICTRPPKMGAKIICKFIDVAGVSLVFVYPTHFLSTFESWTTGTVSWLFSSASPSITFQRLMPRGRYQLHFFCIANDLRWFQRVTTRNGKRFNTSDHLHLPTCVLCTNPLHQLWKHHVCSIL